MRRRVLFLFRRPGLQSRRKAAPKTKNTPDSYSPERGRACAEDSQRIIPYYLLIVNRHCEVLGPKLVREDWRHWGKSQNPHPRRSQGCGAQSRIRKLRLRHPPIYREGLRSARLGTSRCLYILGGATLARNAPSRVFKGDGGPET